MRPLAALCRMGLGQLVGRARRSAEAEEHLSAALALFGAMGMSPWVDRAKAALEALGASP